MKRFVSTVAIMILVLGAASCVRAVRTPETVEQGRMKGIFTEVAEGPIEAGKADLIIKLSMKTHPSNHYVIESKESLHGKPGYPFIVTIDGQSVLWREEGQIEKTPEYDAKGVRTPEGGEGRRYVLEKRLRLVPGDHRVEIDLPEERYTYRTSVVLGQKTQAYVLEYRPVYRPSTQHRPGFLHGLAQLEPFLDGNHYATKP